MRTSSSSLSISSPSAIGLTAAIAVILLAANFTITNAQQQLTSQPGEIENGTAATITTFFQSTNDSFRVHVPRGWAINDVNNTGSALSEESTQGYGILAQLCLQEQQQQQPLSDVSGDTVSCQGADEDIIHIVRYPDLDTRLQAANNGTSTTTTTTTTNNMTTTDNILSYHLQKLEEVGYTDIQIANSTDMTVNLTNPQTNETITTVPAKTVEMTYTTAIAPNQTRSGLLISTATNATAPDLGTTKGYTLFYEGSPISAAETAIASGGSLRPLPPEVRQVFGSFELVVAPQVAQALTEQVAQEAATAEGEDDGDGDDGGGDNGDDEGDDGDNGDDDGNSDGEEGPTMAERIIEETEEMVERIIEETGVELT
jgi:hypothetical protein